MRIRGIAVLLGTLLTAAPLVPLAAQLGRLKDKLVPKPKPEPRKPTEAGLQFDETLIKLTAPVLEGFLRGRQLEVELLKEFKELLARYPTPEKYQQCRSEAAASPEFQKHILSLNIPENASTEEAQRLIAKNHQELEALGRKRCPLDPGDWTLEKKRERLKAIVEQAAAAAGPVTAGPDGAGSAAASSYGSWLAVELQAQGISVAAFKMIDERSVTFCRYAEAHGKPPDLISNVVLLPSPNNPKIHYVYDEDEIAPLLARCPVILRIAQQALAYDPGGLPGGGGPATCCSDWLAAAQYERAARRFGQATSK